MSVPSLSICDYLQNKRFGVLEIKIELGVLGSRTLSLEYTNGELKGLNSQELHGFIPWNGKQRFQINYRCPCEKHLHGILFGWWSPYNGDHITASQRPVGMNLDALFLFFGRFGELVHFWSHFLCGYFLPFTQCFENQTISSSHFCVTIRSWQSCSGVSRIYSGHNIVDYFNSRVQPKD